MPGCQRACLVRTLREPGRRERIDWSDGLDVLRIDELGQLLADDESEMNRVVRLVEFCDRHSLGGITIIQDDGASSRLVMPPGIAESFEPVRLSQGDERLQQIVAADVSHSSGDGLAPQKSRSWISILGIVNLVLALLLVVKIAFRVSRSGFQLESVRIELGVLGVLATSTFRLGKLNRPKWFVAPATLILLRSWRFSARSRFRVVTPDDSILLLTQSKLGWDTRVYSQDAVLLGRESLNDWEWYMLLAAWRSPLPPPTLEQIEQAM